jgi:hypothetical protein
VDQLIEDSILRATIPWKERPSEQSRDAVTDNKIGGSENSDATMVPVLKKLTECADNLQDGVQASVKLLNEAVMELAEQKRRYSDLLKEIGQRFQQETEPSKWYLKVTDGAIYGPVDLSALCDWTAQGRVIPRNEVSNDGKNWMPADSICALRMYWVKGSFAGAEDDTTKATREEAATLTGKIDSQIQEIDSRMAQTKEISEVIAGGLKDAGEKLKELSRQYQLLEEKKRELGTAIDRTEKEVREAHVRVERATAEQVAAQRLAAQRIATEALAAERFPIDRPPVEMKPVEEIKPRLVTPLPQQKPAEATKPRPVAHIPRSSSRELDLIRNWPA